MTEDDEQKTKWKRAGKCPQMETTQFCNLGLGGISLPLITAQVITVDDMVRSVFYTRKNN